MRRWSIFLLAALVAACGPASSTDDNLYEATTCPVGYGGADCSQLLPLPSAPDGVWTWAETEGAICRDGSAAGVSVRYNTGSTNLLIYLEGGGACFNGLTCYYNSPFVESQAPLPDGIFDFANKKNPIESWNMVYVPYCTGDLHLGSTYNASHGDFVGGDNYRLFLERVVKTFGANVNRVLLVGYSAGGMGATVHFDRTASAFGENVIVDLVADAALIPKDQTMEWDNLDTPTAERQTLWRSTWNLDAALPPDCVGCFNAAGGGLSNIYAYLSAKYPQSVLGLISSTQDETLTFFYGAFSGIFSYLLMPACTFQAGAESLASHLATLPNWGTYIFPSADHGRLPLSDFYKDRTLQAWLAAIVDSRSVSNVASFKRCR